MRFPSAPDRGGYFLLQRWTGDEWDIANYLVSDADANGPAVYGADENPCCDEYLVTGQGPDRIILPDTLQTGSWRVCVQNVDDMICGEFTTS